MKPPLPPTGLSAPIVWFMAVAAALGTATIYPLQPGIAEVAGSLDASIGAVGLALACGPVGYLLGLALLVPLVDRHRPNRVLAVQFALLSVVMAASAAVGQVWVLGVVLLAIGAGSSVGAGLSSVAGRLASPHRRAADLGVVTAGISVGVLGGRIVGGLLTDAWGWQTMLRALAAACAVTAVLACFLPDHRAPVTRGYLATLTSMPGLFRRHGLLRIASLRGAMWFFAFCAVWSGLAVALSVPPYSLSAEQIGLYGLAGLSGVVATRIAGRWTDRVGARPVILCGLALAIVSAVGLALSLASPVLTFLCLMVFDAGLFAAQVANQHAVLSLDRSAPARFNGAYMIIYFVGGSIGTAFGAAAVGFLGWPGTAAATALMMAGAVVLTVATRLIDGTPRSDTPEANTVTNELRR